MDSGNPEVTPQSVEERMRDLEVGYEGCQIILGRLALKYPQALSEALDYFERYTG